MQFSSTFQPISTNAGLRSFHGHLMFGKSVKKWAISRANAQILLRQGRTIDIILKNLDSH